MMFRRWVCAYARMQNFGRTDQTMCGSRAGAVFDRGAHRCIVCACQDHDVPPKAA